MKDKARVSHDESLDRELRENSDFAAEYLRAAMEDEAEPRVLLVALRRLAEARGLAKVAKTAGIVRESLYRALSARGNPRFSTLVAVAEAIGLRSDLRIRTLRCAAAYGIDVGRYTSRYSWVPPCSGSSPVVPASSYHA